MKKNVAVPHATPQKPCSPRVKYHFAHIVKPSFRSLLFLLAAGMFLFSCKDDKIEPSSEASLTSLTLTVDSKDYEITFKDRQGTIKLPYATKLPATAKVAAVALSAKATGVKVGDEVTIFDDSKSLIPVLQSFNFTITAEDKTTTQEYTVTVQTAAPSSEAAITTLTLTVGATDYEITFTGTQDTLRVGPLGTPVPAKVGVKEIALSDGATSDTGNGSELSVTDNTVTITVTAEDKKTTQEYTVVLGFTTAGITSFTFEVPDNESMALDEDDRKRIVGMIDQETKTITFAQQSAYVYRDKLKATFEVSEAGAAVQVENEDQESGTTGQDFSAPIEYVVSAEGTETTYTVTLLKSTLATIPDAQFRAKLKDFVPEAFTGDQLDITHDDVVNKDGELNVERQTPKLTSVKGIEFFRALTDLRCFTNRLSSLDVRRNTALRTLYCSENSLPSLDVSKNMALATLDCGANSLTSLDVSKNTALTGLYCVTNRLTSLDVRENMALTSLWCFGNSLTSLYMTGMRSVSGVDGLNIGTGTGTDSEPDNHLLATLRVNTALQDESAIIAMKGARAAALTITTVNNEGDVVCTDYDPLNGGDCNDN